MSELTFTGTMRLHYNKDGADPLNWCISYGTGAWEIAVSKIYCNKPCAAVFQRKETPDDEDGKPSAWFATYGTLRVDEDGVATIE